MLQLRFDKAKCLVCPTHDCLVKCQYLNIDKDTAKVEMQKIIDGEDSFVLHDCVTCYACEEYCKMANHPFYLIVERQEEKGILTAPRPLTNQQVNMAEPVGRFRVGEVKEKAISLCFIPPFIDLVKGRLFENIASSYFFGQEFFCNVMYLHFAKVSVIKERLPKIVENISKLGVKEVVCLHDECYSSFKSLAPAYGIKIPFKFIHYFEYLYNRLKECKDLIKPLNIKVAYQRPCSSRLAPDQEHFVDDLFGLVGAERVKREYEGENALCCGQVIRMLKGYELTNNLQKRNIEDMMKAGAQYCVFNCPYCYMALRDKVTQTGMKPIHMVDLCKLAIGETPGKGVIEYGQYI